MKDKVIFISGGARGFGASVVTQALADGATVFCASRGGTLPEGVEPSGDSRCKPGELDITDDRSCETAIDACLTEFGRIDILLNNASGYFGGKPIGQYPAQDIQNEIAATLLGTILLTNTFVNRANRPTDRQFIVNMSSISGLGREPDNGLHCVYAAAKAGVIRFTETINETLREVNTSAHVLIPNNIRVDRLVEQNAVSQDDVYRVIRFLTQTSDNLYVDQLLLNPFATSPVK